MVEIYCDDLQEGLWFQNLSTFFNESNIEIIGGRNANPPYVERFLRYDRPDIILVIDGEPKLVVEKTSEVPTGHNVGQRFARIANAAEERVMFIKFFPFKARKHGTYTNICHVNARLFIAFEKMMELHNVPVLAMNWSCDSNGELIRDGSEGGDLRILIEELARSNFVYAACPGIGQNRLMMQREYEDRINMRPSYEFPPPTVQIVTTNNYIDMLRGNFSDELQLSENFRNREETLIYTFKMTEEHCRREDPYTGTQFIYDYVWCRNGPQPNNKYRNLVLASPLIRKNVWLEKNPNNPNRKSCVYYAISNLIVLRDGIINNID